MVTLRKVVVAVLLGAFLASVGNLVYLHLYYSFEMPRNSDPVNSRTNAISVEGGFIVYVTQHERNRFFWAENLAGIWSGVALILAMGLAVRWRIIPNKLQ